MSDRRPAFEFSFKVTPWTYGLAEGGLRFAARFTMTVLRQLLLMWTGAFSSATLAMYRATLGRVFGKRRG